MGTRKALVELLCKDMLSNLVQFDPVASVPRCPLCLEPFVIEDPRSQKRPTAEHIIQKSLGGTLEYATATCMQCNNGRGITEGSLKKAMEALDFMDGDGSIAMTIENDVGRVAANMIWKPPSPVTIEIVGEKASKIEAVDAVRKSILPDAKLHFTLHYGFTREAYRRAVLRIGYLAICDGPHFLDKKRPFLR
jgi:hypothetical protein